MRIATCSYLVAPMLLILASLSRVPSPDPYSPNHQLAEMPMLNVTDPSGDSPTVNVTELHGAESGTWQNAINSPSFTVNLQGPSGGWGPGYLLYWGSSPYGTAAGLSVSDHFSPGEVQAGRYFLRIAVIMPDSGSPHWQTVFVFCFDNIPPTPLTLVSERHGSQNWICEDITDEPVFDWTGATDGLSGLDYYEYSFGVDRDVHEATGSSDAPSFSPGRIAPGSYFLSIRARDKAGNYSDWVPYFNLLFDHCFYPAKPPLRYWVLGGLMSVVIASLLPQLLTLKAKWARGGNMQRPKSFPKHRRQR